MSRKGKPATLTSSLLARKGEAEPARLQDGSVPKGKGGHTKIGPS